MARRPRLVFYTLFVVITWKYIGFAIILFLAGLQGIPRELHEAAAIDGATSWQTLRYITLPLLGPDDPDLGLPVDHRLAAAVRPRLDHDARRPGRASSTMATYMIDQGFNSYASATRRAVAVILFFICFVFSILYQMLRRCAATRRADGAGWPADDQRRLAALRLGAVLERAGLRRRARARRRRDRADRLCRDQRLPHDRPARGEPVGLPHPWVTHNYTKVIMSGDFWRQVGTA